MPEPRAETAPGAIGITTDDGVLLAGEQAGAGEAIVLLHGLTATRRYVVMGSRALERSGHRVIAYDARGHGHSTPAPHPRAYGYERLAEDLRVVLDQAGIERALLAGASMGAHTAVRFALEHPERVRGLLVVTPAYDPAAFPAGLERWDALAHGLRTGGVEGFIAAYDFSRLAPAWRDAAERGLRQRMSAHAHPRAVADALSAVPRSRPFETWASLARVSAPTVVVGSRDDADPEHPLAVARAYAQAIPGARLEVEDEGASPIAWQGGRLSRLLLEHLSK
jgi:pimeloyl-ACP methyl ester carboxylesterase